MEEEPVFSESVQAQVDKVIETAVVLQEQVGALTVVDDMSFRKMESMAVTARDNVKALKLHMDGPITDANAKHKKLTALRSKLCQPHEAIARDAAGKCNAYTLNQRKIAEAKQRAVDAEARKQAEDARLEAAAELEAQGQSAQAEAVIAAPIAPAPVAPVADVPKMKGARETWYAVITDPKALFNAWGSGAVPMPQLDEKQLEDLIRVMRLNDLAKAAKGNLSTILPGVESKMKLGG